MSVPKRHRLGWPIIAGLCLALLIAVLSFPPGRAAARQFLSIFRVRRFAVVSVNSERSRLEELSRALDEAMASARDPEVLVEGESLAADSVEHASALSGYPVREPAYLPDRLAKDEVRSIQVQTHSEAAFHIGRDALVILLQVAGMDPAAVPPDLSNATIHVTLPAMVEMRRGSLTLIQAIGLSIEYPDSISPGLFGEAGLRVLGVPADEAHRISESLDWTSTLLLPVPTDVVEFREVTIAGGPGVLLRPHPGADEGHDLVLIWQVDDDLYQLRGPLSPEELIRIAESMF